MTNRRTFDFYNSLQTNPMKVIFGYCTQTKNKLSNQFNQKIISPSSSVGRAQGS
jgi:hypothetical protein